MSDKVTHRGKIPTEDKTINGGGAARSFPPRRTSDKRRQVRWLEARVISEDLRECE